MPPPSARIKPGDDPDGTVSRGKPPPTRVSEARSTVASGGRRLSQRSPCLPFSKPLLDQIETGATERQRERSECGENGDYMERDSLLVQKWVRRAAGRGISQASGQKDEEKGEGKGERPRCGELPERLRSEIEQDQKPCEQGERLGGGHKRRAVQLGAPKPDGEKVKESADARRDPADRSRPRLPEYQRDSQQGRAEQIQRQRPAEKQPAHGLASGSPSSANSSRTVASFSGSSASA